MGPNTDPEILPFKSLPSNIQKVICKVRTFSHTLAIKSLQIKSNLFGINMFSNCDACYLFQLYSNTVLFF